MTITQACYMIQDSRCSLLKTQYLCTEHFTELCLVNFDRLYFQLFLTIVIRNGNKLKASCRR